MDSTIFPAGGEQDEGDSATSAWRGLSPPSRFHGCHILFLIYFDDLTLEVRNERSMEIEYVIYFFIALLDFTIIQWTSRSILHLDVSDN